MSDAPTPIDPTEDLLRVPDLPPLEQLVHLAIPETRTLSAALADYHQAALDLLNRGGSIREAHFSERLQAFLDKHTKDGIVDLLPETIAQKREAITRDLDTEHADAVKRFQLGRLEAGVLLQRELDRVTLPDWRGRLPEGAPRTEQMQARALDLAEAAEARAYLREATLEDAVARYEATSDDAHPGFLAAMERGAYPAARPGHDGDARAIVTFTRVKRARQAARISPKLRESRQGYVETLHARGRVLALVMDRRAG